MQGLVTVYTGLAAAVRPAGPQLPVRCDHRDELAVSGLQPGKFGARQSPRCHAASVPEGRVEIPVGQRAQVRGGPERSVLPGELRRSRRAVADADLHPGVADVGDRISGRGVLPVDNRDEGAVAPEGVARPVIAVQQNRLVDHGGRPDQLQCPANGPAR